tara:strand:+ start:1702 stop:1803 length:102 start_codon:yes stop_codon:yes gene_type:complete
LKEEFQKVNKVMSDAELEDATVGLMRAYKDSKK